MLAAMGMRLQAAVQVLALDSEQPREGQLVVNVETTPMSSADMRPGRPSQVTQCCAEQVSLLLFKQQLLHS